MKCENTDVSAHYLSIGTLLLLQHHDMLGLSQDAVLLLTVLRVLQPSQTCWYDVIAIGQRRNPHAER